MNSTLRRVFLLPNPDMARAMRHYWWVMMLVVAATFLALTSLYPPYTLARGFDTLLVAGYGAVAGLAGHASARVLARRRLRRN